MASVAELVPQHLYRTRVLTRADQVMAVITLLDLSPGLPSDRLMVAGEALFARQFKGSVIKAARALAQEVQMARYHQRKVEFVHALVSLDVGITDAIVDRKCKLLFGEGILPEVVRRYRQMPPFPREYARVVVGRAERAPVTGQKTIAALTEGTDGTTEAE